MTKNCSQFQMIVVGFVGIVTTVLPARMAIGVFIGGVCRAYVGPPLISSEKNIVGRRLSEKINSLHHSVVSEVTFGRGKRPRVKYQIRHLNFRRLRTTFRDPKYATGLACVFEIIVLNMRFTAALDCLLLMNELHCTAEPIIDTRCT